MDPKDAIEFLNDFINRNPDDDRAYYMRGLKHWNLNHHKEAINDYLAALRLNPQSEAKYALEYANSIMDFYHKDLLNP